MNNDDEHGFVAGAVLLQCATVLLLANLLRMRRQHRHIRIGVHPINRRRDIAGHFNNLYVELREHPDRFYNYTRMSLRQFDLLHTLVKDDITKNDKYTKPLPSEMRLVITLRYLATGDNMTSVALAYRIGVSTCREVIYHTCRALWRNLRHTYMAPPSKEDYSRIAREFEDRWNLPHCLGALDGKHIVIKCPPNSGSMFYCYKKHFSVVLMAACDAKYCFTLLDIGHVGSVSDGGIFRSSVFGKKIMDKSLPVPPPKPLPGTIAANARSGLHPNDPNRPDITPFPHFFVGDEAFPLRENIMRPYPRDQVIGRSPQAIQNKIFNYRLSRGRRVIENAFGILAAKWRIFHTVIEAYPHNVVSMVEACCCLHNFIQKTKENVDGDRDGDHVTVNGTVVDGDWRTDHIANNLEPLQIRSNRNASLAVKAARNRLGKYLRTTGSVQWQMEYVTRGLV